MIVYVHLCGPKIDGWFLWQRRERARLAERRPCWALCLWRNLVVRSRCHMRWMASIARMCCIAIAIDIGLRSFDAAAASARAPEYALMILANASLAWWTAWLTTAIAAHLSVSCRSKDGINMHTDRIVTCAVYNVDMHGMSVSLFRFGHDSRGFCRSAARFEAR